MLSHRALLLTPTEVSQLQSQKPAVKSFLLGSDMWHLTGPISHTLKDALKTLNRKYSGLHGLGGVWRRFQFSITNLLQGLDFMNPFGDLILQHSRYGLSLIAGPNSSAQPVS